MGWSRNVQNGLFRIELRGEIVVTIQKCTIDDCEPLYLRQFMIIQEYRRRHYGEQAFQMLLSCLKTDSVDIEVLSNNYQGVKFWEKMGFVERHKYMCYKSN